MNLLFSQFENKQTIKLKVLIDHQSTFFFAEMSHGGNFFWLFLGPDMSQGRKCRRAWLALGPGLSQGWKCLRARLVSRFAAGDVQGRKCLGANFQRLAPFYSMYDMSWWFPEVGPNYISKRLAPLSLYYEFIVFWLTFLSFYSPSTEGVHLWGQLLWFPRYLVLSTCS